MADAANEEKTEKPSAQKRRKAREEGQLPRSKDMGLAASLLAAFIVVSNSFHWYRDFVYEAFLTVHQYGERIGDPHILGQFLQHNLLILLKFTVTLTPVPLAALFASLIPGGWILSLKKIAPDLSKISPLKGVARLFSSEQVIDVGKMILKSLLVLLLLAISLQHHFAAFLDLQTRYFAPAVNEGLALYQEVMLNVVMLFILFALLDVPLAKYMFSKGLRMTRQEVKDEYKNQEGSPEIKARVRRLQRQMALGQIRRVVPQADVVIANPTHFAVALQYDRARAAAPFVVAKGTDEVARYIRDVAREHQVEVVEFPKLARAVYYTTQVNQQIPYQLFRAIAHVLTYVLQLHSWRAGTQARPTLNRHIFIPQEVLKQDAETD